MLGEKNNKGLHDYMKELLAIYRKYPAMYEFDNSWQGFEWLNCDDKDRSTYSFVRKSSDGKKSLMFIINMTPMEWDDYKVGMISDKKMKLILNSDDEQFGGSGAKVKKTLTPVLENCDYKDYAVTLDIPPFSALVYTF